MKPAIDETHDVVRRSFPFGIFSTKMAFAGNGREI